MALTGDEVFGTVVPGFVTDANGNLVYTAAPTTWQVVPGFFTDEDGRLGVSADDPADTWVGGFLRGSGGTLVLSAPDPGDTYQTGFLRSTTGALVSVDNPVETSQSNLTPGFFTDADGALGITA